MTEEIVQPEQVVKQPEDDADLLVEAYAVYDRYDFTASKVIRFRGKTIDEWLEETQIPEVDSHYSLEDLQKINYFAINLMEKINRNYSYAKSAADLATLKYQTAYNREKLSIVQKYADSKTKRLPSADLLESIVINNIEEVYSAYKIADLFCEFWTKQQQKAKSLDGRLTSIGMIHNVEKRNVKYEV